MRVVTFLIFTAFLVVVKGQEDSTLIRKVDSLSEEVSGLKKILNRSLADPRTQTRGNYESGKLPGFVYSNDKNISLEISGWVQTDVLADWKEMSNKYGFQPSSIIVQENVPDLEVNVSVRQTRFIMKSYFPLENIEIKTHFEFDLFNTNTSFNLRHAYGEFNGFLVGKTFSNFMSIETFPNIVDYWGPNSMVFYMPIQFRYTFNPIKDKHVLSASLEYKNPDLSYDTSGVWNSWEIIPDLTFAYRYNFKKGFLKTAGLIHALTYQTGNETKIRKGSIGWGLAIEGLMYVWGKKFITFQIAGGTGISGVYNDIGGKGQEGVVASSGELTMMNSIAGFLSYNHWWVDKFATTIGWGYLGVTNASPDLFLTNFNFSNYGVLSLLYYPFSSVKFGLELLYGDADYLGTGGYGNSLRLQLSFMYKF